jgi:hypothetical protein
VPNFPRSVGFLPIFFPFHRGRDCLAVQDLPPPSNPFQIIIFPQAVYPHLAEYPSLGPQLEIPMRCAARIVLSWEHLPLAASTQHVQNPIQDLSRLRDGSARFGSSPFRLRYVPLDFFPKLIADIPPSRLAWKRLSVLSPSQVLFPSPRRTYKEISKGSSYLGTHSKPLCRLKGMSFK